MEINKETLNSLKRGDFVKYKKIDFESGWTIIRGFYQRDGINYISVVSFDYPQEPFEIETSSVIDIRKSEDAVFESWVTKEQKDAFLGSLNPWIKGLSERLGNPWGFTEFDWKKSQEKIQKAMNKDLIASMDCEIFKSITERMLETYKKKNADYGSSFDKSMEEFGIISAVVRMSDKMERLKSLAKKDAKVKDESIEDTLLDLANYCIMTVMHLKINKEEDGE